MSEALQEHGGPAGAAGNDGATDVVALGNALRERAEDVARRTVAAAQRILKAYTPAQAGQIEGDVRRNCTLATLAVAGVLTTGEAPSAEQWRRISATGRAPASESISLADMTKLFLHWRDEAIAVLGEEVQRLGVSGAVRRRAEAVVRAGCDSSLVRAARVFDSQRGEMQAHLADDQARLAYLAGHDSLTGLPNRMSLFDRLGNLVESCRSAERGGAVLFLDLDGFKTVNDVAGHSAGDQLLIQVASRIADVVRPQDTVVRLGGDEFVVICEDLRDPAATAPLVADRILMAMGAPFRVYDIDFFTSASIGVAVVGPRDDPDRLLSSADKAMYAAKQRGRGRVELFHDLSSE